METIKKNWKIIVIVFLILFGMNKCTVSCNRSTTINKQQVELLQKDSIIKAQSDSLKLFAIRWDENKKGQENYQNLATGTKQELTDIINEMKNTISTMTNKIQSLTNENNKLKKENKQLKEQLNGK